MVVLDYAGRLGRVKHFDMIRSSLVVGRTMFSDGQVQCCVHFFLLRGCAWLPGVHGSPLGHILDDLFFRSTNGSLKLVRQLTHHLQVQTFVASSGDSSRFFPLRYDFDGTFHQNACLFPSFSFW
ncbi:unnamed protein product [Hapterophycus canaliculatus]